MKLRMSGTERYPVDLGKYNSFTVSNGGWVYLFKPGEHCASAIVSTHGVLIEETEEETEDKDEGI